MKFVITVIFDLQILTLHVSLVILSPWPWDLGPWIGTSVLGFGTTVFGLETSVLGLATLVLGLGPQSLA